MRHPATTTTATCVRASLLVLLLLGVMIRPVLNQVGQLHLAQHAALAVEAGASDHDAGTFHADADPDHAAGGHSLMHMTDTGTSVWIFADWIVTVPALAPAGLHVDMAGQPPSHRPVSPFRPPIA